MSSQTNDKVTEIWYAAAGFTKGVVVSGYPKNIEHEPQDQIRQEYDSFPEKYKLKEPDQKNISTGGRGMSDINHCIASQGGMSECEATNLKTSQQKLEAQKICVFFNKAQFEPRCMWEVQGEFCWNTQAQDQVKGK